MQMHFVPKWVHVSQFFISGIPVYMFPGITHMRKHTMPSLSFLTVLQAMERQARPGNKARVSR